MHNCHYDCTYHNASAASFMQLIIGISILASMNLIQSIKGQRQRAYELAYCYKGAGHRDTCANESGVESRLGVEGACPDERGEK